jgi:hypothetical protein
MFTLACIIEVGVKPSGVQEVITALFGVYRRLRRELSASIITFGIAAIAVSHIIPIIIITYIGDNATVDD